MSISNINFTNVLKHYYVKYQIDKHIKKHKIRIKTPFYFVLLVVKSASALNLNRER